MADVSDTTAWMLLVVGGMTIGVLLVSVYKASVVACGMVAGMLMTNLVYQLLASNIEEVEDDNETLRIGVTITLAIIGGALALWLHKIVLRTLTAFVGGYMFVAGVDHWAVEFGAWEFPSLDPMPNEGDGFFADPLQFECGADDYSCWSLVGVWLLLFSAGLWYQNRMRKKMKEGGPPPQQSERKNIQGANSTRVVGADGRQYILLDDR